MDFTREDTEKFLIGSLLGDMFIEGNAISNTQSIIHSDYSELKHLIFSKYYRTGKIGLSHNWGTNKDPELRVANRFRIYDKNLTSKMKSLLYDSNNVKHIPDLSYMSIHSILFWYLDDGSLISGSTTDKKTGKLHGKNDLRIALKSYSDSNILNFIDQFYEKYKIKFNTESKDNKIIRIYISSKRDILAFFKLLYPLYDIIPKSMYYKFQPIITDKKVFEENSYLIK